jgi:AcrR family transcriptional regulator
MKKDSATCVHADTPELSRTRKKQEHILAVATELFLERGGYDAVSLDDVLERAGGSKTTLYSYYGGKEGLFAAIFQKMCSDKLGPLLLLDVAGLDPQAGLTAIGEGFLPIIAQAQGRALFRMMVAEADRFPKLAAEFYAAGPQTVVSLIRRHIERWMTQGLLRNGNAEILAVQFIGIMLGTFQTKSLLGLTGSLSAKEIKDWVSSGVKLFLEGAAVR